MAEDTQELTNAGVTPAARFTGPAPDDGAVTINAPHWTTSVAESRSIVPIEAAPEFQLEAGKHPKIVWRAKSALRRVHETVDAREVAGGFAGLAAGEIVGRTVGGAVGALFGGPLGAVVGAEVGGFTGGVLGMTVGGDAVHDLVADAKDGKDLKTVTAVEGAPTPQDASPAPGDKPGTDKRRRGVTRIGQAVGVASGASVGRLVAGPVGGVLGAVIGEVVGGQVANVNVNTPAKEKAEAAPQRDPSSQSDLPAQSAQQANRTDEGAAGESTTTLIGGAVGSVFGPIGRAIGRRAGFVLGRSSVAVRLRQPRPDVRAIDEPGSQYCSEGA